MYKYCYSQWEGGGGGGGGGGGRRIHGILWYIPSPLFTLLLLSSREISGGDCCILLQAHSVGNNARGNECVTFPWYRSLQ